MNKTQSTQPDNNAPVSLEEWEDIVQQSTGIPRDLWKAMSAQESGNNWNAVSPTNVRGKYQVTKATAAQYGLDRDDPFQQVAAAGRYLRDQYDALKDIKDDGARWLGAVGRYYGGPDAVDQQGNISPASKDGVSNPAEHIERVARKMRDIQRHARQSGIDPQIDRIVGEFQKTRLQANQAGDIDAFMARRQAKIQSGAQPLPQPRPLARPVSQQSQRGPLRRPSLFSAQDSQNIIQQAQAVTAPIQNSERLARRARLDQVRGELRAEGAQAGQNIGRAKRAVLGIGAPVIRQAASVASLPARIGALTTGQSYDPTASDTANKLTGLADFMEGASNPDDSALSVGALGQYAGMIATGLGPGRVARAIAPGAGIASTITRGAIAGSGAMASQVAGQPVSNAEVAKQAGAGAVGGVAGDLAAKAAGPVVQKIGNRAIRGAANIGAASTAGGLGNVAQAAAGGETDPNALGREFGIGAALGAIPGVTSLGEGRPGQAQAEAQTIPGASDLALRPRPSRLGGPSIDAGTHAAAEYTAKADQINKSLPAGPERVAALRQLREEYRQNRRANLPETARENLNRAPLATTPEEARIQAAESLNRDLAQQVETERLTRQLPRQAGSPEPTEPLTGPRANSALDAPVAPPPRDPRHNLVEMTRAKANAALQENRFDDAVNELRAHQEALRQLKASVGRSAPGERVRLERSIGQVGNEIGNARKLARESARAARLTPRIAERQQKDEATVRAGEPPVNELSPAMEAAQRASDIMPETSTGRIDFAALADSQQRGKGEKGDNLRLLPRIRQLGGINPAGEYTGDLQNAVDKRYPGLINRKSGLKPDTLIEYLHEDGYPVDRHDLNTLWQAIDDDATGKQVLPIQRRRTDEIDAEMADYYDRYDDRPQFVLDAEERLSRNLTGELSGSGAQAIIDSAIVAGHRIYRAGVAFKDWARQMVRELGEKVRPHLRAIYDQIKAASIEFYHDQEGSAKVTPEAGPNAPDRSKTAAAAAPVSYPTIPTLKASNGPEYIESASAAIRAATNDAATIARVERMARSAANSARMGTGSWRGLDEQIRQATGAVPSVPAVRPQATRTVAATPPAPVAPTSGRDVKGRDYLRSPLSNLNYVGTYEKLGGETGKQISDIIRQAQVDVANGKLTQPESIQAMRQSLRPLQEQLRADGKPGLARWVDAHVDAVANPDDAFKGLAGFLKASQFNLKLRWNPRSAAINLMQPFQTLWPFMTTREFAKVATDARRPATRRRVTALIGASGGKIEGATGGASGKLSFIKNPFAKVSETNQITGYLAGEMFADRQGLTGDAKARMAADWAKKVEFDNSLYDVPPLFRGNIASVVGQFKPFMIKNLERIAADWKASPEGTSSGTLARRSKMIFSQVAVGGVKSALLPGVKQIGGVLILGGLAKALSKVMNEDDANKLAEAVYFGAPSLISQDLSSSMTVIDTPFGETPAEKIVNFAGGPTLSLLMKGWMEGEKMYDAKDGKTSRSDKLKGSALRLSKTITPYTKTAQALYHAAKSETPTFRMGGKDEPMTKAEAVGYGLMSTPVRQSRFYEESDAYGWQRRALGMSEAGEIERKAGEPDDIYKLRSKRVSEWKNTYEGQLRGHARFATLTPDQQKQAVENLHRNISIQSGERAPRVASLAPARIIAGVLRSEREKPRRDARRLYSEP